MECNSYHIFFRNLSNPTKIKIISELKQNPLSVSELSEKLNLEQSKISHALSSLRFCSLVEVNQKGNQRIYSLNKDTILPILKIIDAHKCKFCKEVHNLK